jgi:SM-20-related protein
VSLLPDEPRLASLVDYLADGLADQGYVVIDDALPETLATALRHEAMQLQEDLLRPAGTGRNHDHHLDSQVRADAICWLEPTTDASNAYLSIMETIRKGLNSKLYLGLFEYECHYARYEAGAFYKTHLDAFGGKRNRVISTTYYLNQEWTAANEGELVLYAPDAKEQIAILAPTFNRMVVFMSERFPHEVLPTRQVRYSLTGWFRINTRGN